MLDKAWAFGIPHITFTGGEPTLREDLPALIAHAEANGQVTGLLTDGLKLADDAYLNSLLQTGLDHLAFYPCNRKPLFLAGTGSMPQGGYFCHRPPDHHRIGSRQDQSHP